MSTLSNETNYQINDDQLQYYIFIHILTTIVVPVLFLVIGIVGLLGNCLVVYVIVSQRRMRTVTNLMLLNLAASDIIFLCVCLPFRASAYSGSWNYGLALCRVVHYMAHVTCYVTIYTLVAISLLRYLVIVYGNSSRIYQTRRNIVLASLGIWTVIMAVNSPMLTYFRIKTYWTQGTAPLTTVVAQLNHTTPATDATPPFDATSATAENNEAYHICGLHSQAVMVNFWCLAVFGYALPLLVICSLYYAIMNFLKRTRKASQASNKTQSVYRSVRASRLIMLVVTVFGLSWFPLQFNAIYSLYNTLPQMNKLYEVARVLFVALAYSNSAANPIIYSFVSEDFRKGFRKAMHIRNTAAERSTDATTKSELLRMVPHDKQQQQQQQQHVTGNGVNHAPEVEL